MVATVILKCPTLAASVLGHAYNSLFFCMQEQALPANKIIETIT